LVIKTHAQQLARFRGPALTTGRQKLPYPFYPGKCPGVQCPGLSRGTEFRASNLADLGMGFQISRAGESFKLL